MEIHMRPPMPFPDAITVFHGRQLPCEAVPAGYAALIAAYGLRAPLPRKLFAIGSRHRIIDRDGWRLLTPRHAPAATLEGHLTFALKYEGLDLAILKALFDVLNPAVIEAMVRARPTGRYVRRIWFFYEWLAGRALDLPPLRRASYVNALDPALQYPGRAVNSPRHRVRNNLPGTPAFCPLVFRTEALERFAAIDFAAQARERLAGVPEEEKELLSVVLVNGEVSPCRGPEATRAMCQQWTRGVSANAGPSVTVDEIAILHRVNAAAVKAKHPGLDEILSGISAFAANTALPFPPPLTAACLAFGYALATGVSDPYEPVHRYLAQKHFARTGYRAGNYMLSVSITAHQRRFAEYRRLLERGSRGGLFDATPHAEFFYRCLKDTIEIVLPDARRFVSRQISAGPAAAE